MQPSRPVRPNHKCLKNTGARAFGAGWVELVNRGDMLLTARNRFQVNLLLHSFLKIHPESAS